MATYEQISWLAGDEVTSGKLSQMTKNSDWLKDNLITGNVTYRTGNNGEIAFQRPPGSYQINRVEGLYQAFSSNGQTVQHVVVTITYPPVFSTPPIAIASIAQGSGQQLAGVWTTDYTTTKAKYIVYRRDGASQIFNGALNVMLLGQA